MNSPIIPAGHDHEVFVIYAGTRVYRRLVETRDEIQQALLHTKARRDEEFEDVNVFDFDAVRRLNHLDAGVQQVKDLATNLLNAFYRLEMSGATGIILRRQYFQILRWHDELRDRYASLTEQSKRWVAYRAQLHLAKIAMNLILEVLRTSPPTGDSS